MGLKYFYCDDNFTNFTLKMLRLTILLIAFPIIIDLPFFILDGNIVNYSDAKQQFSWVIAPWWIFISFL